jgi:hypothetical protein
MQLANLSACEYWLEPFESLALPALPDPHAAISSAHERAVSAVRI